MTTDFTVWSVDLHHNPPRYTFMSGLFWLVSPIKGAVPQLLLLLPGSTNPQKEEVFSYIYPKTSLRKQRELTVWKLSASRQCVTVDCSSSVCQAELVSADSTPHSNSDWSASESICHHPSIVLKKSSLWRGTDSSRHVFSTVPTTTTQHQKEKKKHSAGRRLFSVHSYVSKWKKISAEPVSPQSTKTRVFFTRSSSCRCRLQLAFSTADLAIFTGLSSSLLNNALTVPSWMLWGRITNVQIWFIHNILTRVECCKWQRHVWECSSLANKIRLWHSVHAEPVRHSNSVFNVLF